ncbi:MAG: radical SAM protein [Myxococcota bacterium]
MANIGYIQVVRHCNHFCGFCSNPTTPYVHTFDTMKVLVDDFVERGYFGVILTGGEPTLHPDLPQITRYARDQGLHVRMITNGHRLADRDLARDLAEAGLQHVHVSVYSIHPEVEARLRGQPKTLKRAFRAIDNAHAFGMTVDVNCVINKLNADHLDENIAYFIEHHPYVRHFVWNNIDPAMGRAEVNQDQFTPRLADFEASLHRALSLLHSTGRTFRVERVPLCYMTEFAWASTETRKIVKGEERIVHFLDAKQTVRQTDWGHIYSEACDACSLRAICGGLYDKGDAFDPAELYPVFVDRDPIVERIIQDPADPSFEFRSLDAWRADFDRRLTAARAGGAADREREGPPAGEETPQVGFVDESGLRLFQKKRRAEARMAERTGYQQEDPRREVPTELAAEREPSP